MARITPTVRGGVLTWYVDTHEHQISVDTPAWYAWLEEVSTFAFVSEIGTFTARKEPKLNGGVYWKAYRKWAGKLRHAYLGKSHDVTLERLNAVAAVLSHRGFKQDRRVPEDDTLQIHQASIISSPTNEIATQHLTQPESAPKHNLPLQLTSFIGREQDAAAAEKLLQHPDVRLLTLTGTGGVGKTRLALQIATDLLGDFVDGVCFVPLAAISEPELVMSAISRQLGIQEIGTQSIFEQVKVALQEKRLLLVLDNFEQVVLAAPQVEELLIACSFLKVMVTSRGTLHLQAEYVFPVLPLPLPDLAQLPENEALFQYAAVALFIQRARMLLPTFSVTLTTARSIAEICVRLDGLPLAIELAAARIRLLSPQALLARLSQRFQLLTRGAQEMPLRQQTLRNTIQWSYDLLTAEEQRLFRQLSVFVGGFTLEEVEAVRQLSHETEPGTGSTLDSVESLLDKSLLLQVVQEGEEPRLTMLETVREYGLECLRESGEAHVCQRGHALYYLALAEEAEPHLKGAQQVLWWKRLEWELGNLRAALAWLIEQEEGELALCLSGALWWFWNIRGYWSEGWRWLEAALGLPQAQERTARRAKALSGAAEFASRFGNSVFHALIEECLTIYRELGDKRGLTESLSRLGWAMAIQNDGLAARALLEEGLVFAREVGDPWILANSLRNLGAVVYYQDEIKSGRFFLEGSVMLYRQLKDTQLLSRTLSEELTRIAVVEGRLAQATALAQESLTLARELNNGPDVSRALYWLAMTKLFYGDAVQAAALFEESLTLAREQGDKRLMGNILLTLGNIKLYEGDLLQAETYAQESLALFREVSAKDRIAGALSVLGNIRRRHGDLIQARALCTEAVLLARERESRYGPPTFGKRLNFISLAKVTAAEGQLEQAARLFGAIESRLNPSVEMNPFDRADYECVVQGVREQLGEEAFATAWTEGRTMTQEQILADRDSLGLPEPAHTIPPSPVVVPHRASLARLTPREMDVLRLLAKGLTSAQIAEQLVIGLVTVNSHVRSIYSKLGVSSRSAATRYVMEHKLV